MKRLVMRSILLAAGLTTSLAQAAGGGAKLEHAPIDLGDKDSLQRGAHLFVNYCMSCHAISYMRYQRLADDLGFSEKDMRKNLMFPADKIHEPMTVAMPEDQSAQWFGRTPPDLSTVSRSRGNDWLYTYLKSFYLDDTRPWGVNNAVFKDVGMPHVLWELQGWQKPVVHKVNLAYGSSKEVTELELIEGTGSMTPAEYDQAIGDLVNFLAYVGEPAKRTRLIMGWFVLGFLFILLVFAYRLKKEYWKDVH
ncbi:MAG: cytochrome c1 [Gammaproteobacteria bacterium]